MTFTCSSNLHDISWKCDPGSKKYRTVWKLSLAIALDSWPRKYHFQMTQKIVYYFSSKSWLKIAPHIFSFYLIFQRGLGLWMWRTRRVDENRLVTCLCWRKGLTSPVWIDLLEEKSFSPSDSCGNIKSNFTEMGISCQEFHKIRLKCNKCYFLWVI